MIARGKQDQLYRLLAGIAGRPRSEAPQPFYPMRAVSARFGVSLWTVQAVYRRLETEGLLACIRGHGSVIPAHAGAARVRPAVRGVVVVLVWLPGFILIADYRFCVMQLEERLRQRNFVADIVFYREDEKPGPALASRVLTHHPDAVIWLTPGPEDAQTMDTLADAGIRLLAICDQPVGSRTRGYLLDWRRALAAVLRQWRREGFREVLVPVDVRPLTSCTQVLPELLREEGFRLTYFRARAETMQRYLARLARCKEPIVFDDDIWHARLNSQAPRAFADVLAANPRTLQLRSLAMPPPLVAGIRTDALVLPWQAVVGRVVADLNAGRTSPEPQAHVFAASWRHRRPAAEFVQLHAYEAL
jgi:hypothetical protein